MSLSLRNNDDKRMENDRRFYENPSEATAGLC